jgi:hypothetical protein
MFNAIINFFKNKEERKKQKRIQELEPYFEKVMNEIREKEEKIKKEYYNFFYSTDNLIGQPIDVIKELNTINPTLEKRIVNIPSKGICPTCGGKVINGKCLYCGNEYDEHTEILELKYECEFGEKTYVFKNGFLTKINTNAIPIENLI